MLADSLQIHNLIDLRNYVHYTLCEQNELARGTFEITERILVRGKKACGIRVRSESGGPCGYGRAFGRNLVARVIGLVPLVGLIDVLWPLWDDKKQCLHDKAGSTIVVRA